MQIIFVLLTLCAGIASASQSGTNQTLQKSLMAPLWTVAVVATLTMGSSIAVAALSGEKLPSGDQIASAPWWAWLGGLLGLGFVLGTVYSSPRLGAGLFMALVVTAEVLTGLILDHFGLLGFEMHQAGWGRIFGATFMVIGLSLIATN